MSSSSLSSEVCGSGEFVNPSPALAWRSSRSLKKKEEEVLRSLAMKMAGCGVSSQELATGDFPSAEGRHLIQAIMGCSGGGAPPAASCSSSTSGSRGLGWAVILTDTVFWFILFPYLLINHSTLNYRRIIMHSLNAVFLLGDAALNSLPFPWFRIAYFFLWTALYVVFQWIVHAKHNTMWPYKFLDLSWKLAPLWYAVAGLLQIPCYMLFFYLVVRLKPRVLSKWFPGRYLGG